jgi:Fe-S-cluster containining protein
MSRSEGGPIELDLSLLRGFAYACRPGCGLCCYAEPAVTPSERRTLEARFPKLAFVAGSRTDRIAAAPDGGACRLLDGTVCRGHALRPATCRRFPLAVHVGLRAQATVVLTCPGVELSGLRGYRGPTGAADPVGFDAESRAARASAGSGLPRAIAEATRRRHRLARRFAEAGRWAEDSEVRERLGRELPWPSSSDLPGEVAPSRDDGLELLPLVFVGRPTPWAIGSAPMGAELLELRPSGGAREVTGAVPLPEEPPRVAPAARELLEGYLRYWLERDAFFGIVHLAMAGSDEGTVNEWAEAELRRITATVLTRAHLLDAALGRSSQALGDDSILLGIRATDQDLLDRPTWGTPG